MGYYTNYELTLRDPKDMREIVESDIFEKVVSLLKEKGVIGYALDENLLCNGSVKWYKHDDDMRDISKKIPDVLFCLWGNGEEPVDLWEHYFLNGKSQYCLAEIPPFDPAKLE